MRIEIVGAGVIGSAFGRALLAKGHDVRWVDCRPERVDDLRGQGLRAASPDEPAEPRPLFFLCVPTPTIGHEQDRAALADALARVASLLRPELSPTVVIRSTILPGTSRQWAVPLLERESGLRHGDHFRLVYLPEFLRERHAAEDAAAPRIHLLGEWETGHGDVVAGLLADFQAPITRVSLEAAELQKYIHNVFNALKIGFFNEMRHLATRMSLSADIEAMFAATCLSAEGMWNPSYGTRDWGPVAGRCLPKDVEAFVGWMRARGFEVPSLAGLSASTGMPRGG